MSTTFSALALRRKFHQNTPFPARSGRFRGQSYDQVTLRFLRITLRDGRTPYRSDAARLGELCGQNAVDVVYGGGHVGLMGVVADAAMEAGGKVIGFIPERLLDWEVGHHGISELVVTDNMSDRKDKMVARSDAFAILPGGLGTLDELFEVLTLRQLGYHEKPIILINIDGFWDPLAALVRQVVEHGFCGCRHISDDADRGQRR